ncbi:helix-turn-helix domain-containing protein [Pelagerythrobacter rhizovicinus]|uniref:DNA-binding protein n=1 Tax=Pelagerythrobacter rhizovicinus TaxID=2268576 RepID=A0A4Q2KLM2_9SPHN|nr:helix-turn-helix domain-containing protein [Pelagerythrobacter rhizovicinus]RXZ64253.1 DNA-binding protein [Pelagerythrobacter rhizovicinus]
MTNDRTIEKIGSGAEWLTEAQTAERLNMSAKYLQKCRYAGGGPKFAKFGSAVRYSIADIEAFERSSLRDNTSERTGTRSAE